MLYAGTNEGTMVLVGAASRLSRWDSSCDEEVDEVSPRHWLVHVVLGVRVLVEELVLGRKSVEGEGSTTFQVINMCLLGFRL